MTPWRVAASLARFREQANELWPNRSKASDGTIGDAAHAASTSDHNPNAAGVVTAFDLTHDPAHGVDIASVAETLRLHRDPRVKYVIANGRIFAGNDGPSPWVWRRYSGADPHTNHLHLSVLTSLADITRPWVISPPLPNKETQDMDADQSAKLDETWKRVYETQQLAGNASRMAEAASVRTQRIEAKLAELDAKLDQLLGGDK